MQSGFSDHQNYIEKSKWKQRVILTSEITPKKVRGNNVDFSSIEITSKKVPRNNVDFSTSEIKSKKYVEMTWKFVVIWSSTYRRNIDVDLTWYARCYTGSKSRGVFKSFSNIYGETLSQVCFRKKSPWLIFDKILNITLKLTRKRTGYKRAETALR